MEEKDAQPTERTAALWGLWRKNQFKNLGELHKEWTEAGVKASRATTHRRFKEFGYSCRQRRLTWAKENKNWTVAQWSKVLLFVFFFFLMRANFVFHLETKVLESGGRVEKLIAQVYWSPVLSFHSLWWFGVECHLLVLVQCVFFKNQRHCTRLPIHFGALHASFCWPTFKEADFIFQQDLAPAHTAKSTILGYCQEENEKQETLKCRWAEGHCQRNLGFLTTSAVPQNDHLHAKPNWGSN